MMDPVNLPWSLRENPKLKNWVDFSRPGLVRVFTAKVELGQGIVTAMAQIAAAELRVPLDRVIVISGDTRVSPNESYTAGSLSIEIGGTSLRMACAEAREAIVRQAASIVNVATSRIGIEGGAILIDGQLSSLDYWTVAQQIDTECRVTGDAKLTDPATSQYLGKSVARLDLMRKITGGAFIHDLTIPHMVHARILRPPSLGARLSSLDTIAAAHVPGVVKIFRDGDFVGVCCEKEYQAIKALAALSAGSEWTEDEAAASMDQNWKESLPRLRSFDSHSETAVAPTSARDMLRMSATYTRPPIAHATMGPSCAIAEYGDAGLTVWTHSQGVFPLRAALAIAFELEEDAITVIHVPGAGCYGHNGADDAAFDAALLAREVPGRPVRVQWMRDDELAWEPFGSPMVVKIDGAVSREGAIASWSTEIWSAPHGRRPNARAANLLGAAHLAAPIPFPELHEELGKFAGGARNSDPPYTIGYRRVLLHSIPDLPFRTSALRTLGAYANVFAVESFMDELALAAGLDPLEFRLRNLTDPRGRRILERVAEMANWRANAARGTGFGAGLGYCRYKTTAAYVAVVAEVEIGAEVAVRKVYCAVDAGSVVNPDGVINQIEGGITQSISWTLKEQVKFDRGRVTTRSWEEYPILRFDEVPDIQVCLLDSPGTRFLGVGEAAHGPAAAAVANAVAVALDMRIRDLPLTRQRIIGTGSRV